MIENLEHREDGAHRVFNTEATAITEKITEKTDLSGVARAQSGHVDAVDLLLQRGLDVNYREKGDNTYAMHWVATVA